MSSTVCLYAGLFSICRMFIVCCAKNDVTAVSRDIQGILFLQLKCSPKKSIRQKPSQEMDKSA